MPPRFIFVTILFVLVSFLAAEEKPAPDTIHAKLRSRVELFKGTGSFAEVSLPASISGKKTALVICDMWDKHWCENATTRCDELCKKAAPLVEALRKKGVTIIHCPSDCMDHYKDTPQRKAILALPKVAPPKDKTLPDPPLPIDDSDGGCDDAKPVKSYRAWKQQHSAIRIADEDYVSDQGREVYNVIQAKGIETLLVMGVHTNMCVLHRSFAIKQMTRWGVKCVLIRDITDTMYNPKKRPFVKHEEGTELVIRHIEAHWCPTTTSAELMR
jgi:nicotinamidase-related amidase